MTSFAGNLKPLIGNSTNPNTSRVINNESLLNITFSTVNDASPNLGGTAHQTFQNSVDYMEHT